MKDYIQQCDRLNWEVLLTRAMIVVPFCREQHWFAVAIFPNMGKKTVIVLPCDSLRKSTELKSALGQVLKNRGQSGTSIVMKKATVPEQLNATDCCIFMLLNIFHLTKHCLDEPATVPDVGRNTFNQSDVDLFRQHLKEFMKKERCIQLNLHCNPPLSLLIQR